MSRQQHRFEFPDDNVGIVSGVVCRIPREIGDLVVSALTHVCEQLGQPLLVQQDAGLNHQKAAVSLVRERSDVGSTKKWCERCHENKGCWTNHDTAEHESSRATVLGAHFVPPPPRQTYGTVQFRFAGRAPLDALMPIEKALKEELLRLGVSEEQHNLRRINVQAGRTELTSLAGTIIKGDDTEGPLVVDTDDVSRLFKGDSRSVHLKKILDEYPGQKMISFQTQAELYAWILQTGFSPERRQRLQDLLADFQVVWPDNDCSLIWANLMNQRRALGHPAGAQDMWVAATAIRHGAKLCTANVKDYSYLSQLELLSVYNTITRELHIQNFLRKNKGNESMWNKLRESVWVMRSEVNPSLVLLNVKIHAATDDPGNRVYGCRGLILDEADDYRIVNYPFNSFFNMGTQQSRRLTKKWDWPSCTIFPKLDGTLVCLYYFNNDFRVSTRGHPDASSSILEKDSDSEGMSFASLFWKTWEELRYKLPPRHGPWIRRTYCFELLTPANRVVVPVEKPRIVLTMVRDLDTLEEMVCEPIANELQWETVKPEPPVSAPEELQARADHLSPVQGEGYVVVDPSWARIKVKSRRYVLAASLPRPNWGWKDQQSAFGAVDDAQLLKLVLAGESDEFVTYFPEWSSRFLEVQAKLSSLVDELEKLLSAALQSGGTIKQVHAWLSERCLPSGLMGILLKSLKEQLYGGESVTTPDRSHLREILCKEKPVKVLFWSSEMARRTQPSTVPMVTATDADDRTPSDREQEETDHTRLWQWRPYFSLTIQYFPVFIAAFAVLITIWKELRPPQILWPQVEYSVAICLAVIAVGVLVGYNAVSLRCKGRWLLAKFAACKRSGHLSQEMQRLTTLHENVNTVEILARTAILEGFLRRLSRNSLKHCLVLRGSLLTRQIVHPQVRVARDLDFIALFPWKESDPVGEVLRHIKEICDLHESDGVSFGDSATIIGEVIWEETRFPGVKVSLSSASLYGHHRQTIEIDVAFNDPLDPPPFWLKYEALPVFHASKSFHILSVRPELLFAWKLHGLFEHNTINELGQDIQGRWRMKDLHDLWLMARAFTSNAREGIPVELKYISLAVEVAFASREQDPMLIQRVISRDFGSSAGSKRRWNSYRSMAACPDELPAQLHSMVDDIVEFIEPLLHEMLERRGGFETILQEKSPTSIESLDTTAMISELPGRWNVLRNQAKVEFEDVGFEEVLQLVKGPANSLIFGNRSEQYYIDRVKPSKGTRLGSVTLKQAPPFTMRGCTANLVARRVPVQFPSDADADILSETPVATTHEEELDSVRSSAEVEMYKAEMPRDEAEKGVFEASKHLLANRLARRLDVLPPLQKIVYVTSSKTKYLEAKKVLGRMARSVCTRPPIHQATISQPGYFVLARARGSRSRDGTLLFRHSADAVPGGFDISGSRRSGWRAASALLVLRD